MAVLKFSKRERPKMKKLMLALVLMMSFACLASGELKCERVNGISWVYETQDGTAAIYGMTNRPSGGFGCPRA